MKKRRVRITPARRARSRRTRTEKWNLAFGCHQRTEADVAPVSDLGEHRIGGGGDVESVDEQQREPVTHAQTDGLERLRTVARPIGIRPDPRNEPRALSIELEHLPTSVAWDRQRRPIAPRLGPSAFRSVTMPSPAWPRQSATPRRSSGRSADHSPSESGKPETSPGSETCRENAPSL